MPTNQLNVEYWFRLLYNCIHGGCYGGTSATVDVSQFMAWLAHLWLWVVLIGYALIIIALISIVYTTVRLFELRQQEEHFYSKLLVEPGAKGSAHPRFEHIQSLVSSTNPSDWRNAVIEADILLEDLLQRAGYTGAGVGEKLKMAGSSLKTSKDAWEAHKVRNQIAHEGSSFELSEALMRRTIAHYETTFRELGEI